MAAEEWVALGANLTDRLTGSARSIRTAGEQGGQAAGSGAMHRIDDHLQPQLREALQQAAGVDLAAQAAEVVRPAIEAGVTPGTGTVRPPASKRRSTRAVKSPSTETARSDP